MALYLIIELNIASYISHEHNFVCSNGIMQVVLQQKLHPIHLCSEKDFGPRWCSIAAATLVSVWHCILGDVQTSSTFT